MYRILNRLILTLLPDWIHQRLIGDWNKEGLKKYFANTSWMFLARITALIISFLTTAYVARYLGPENFGNLSYAQNFVSLLSVLASLGIDQVLYRELVAHPKREKEFLGTAIISKLVFGSLTFFVTLGAAFSLHENTLLTWMIGIIALLFIIQPIGVLSYYFQAKVQAKYPSYIAITLAFLLPALKLLVIYFDKGVLFFSGIIAIEALITSLALVLFYKYIARERVFDLRFSWPVFTSLIRDSWPLILAGLSSYIYGRIDQVMIMHYLGATTVGYYDVSIRLTELLGFIPGIIIGSVFPAVVLARTYSATEYHKRLKSLTVLCLSISLFLVLVVFILAPVIIHGLYGNQFEPSIALLRLNVWSAVGGMAIILIQNYLIIENRSRQFLVYSISGAIFNVCANAIFIPLYGAKAAIITTLCTYALLIVAFFITQAVTRGRQPKPTA